MQKLVFTNGGGQIIDLTSVLNGGNFGITNWEGLSNTELNIQTQQVPFQDGGVFLDALMEQREISVTVAIQDNNDLSLRYELKRQLISALNPKLGEGVLIYTNDYLSRQIKAVPQLPIFENKNSNDAGTLKASVVFSCPSPYWEDLEETVVELQKGKTQQIINNGDIPCGVKIDIDTTQIGNPVIKNITNGKKILLQGLFGTDLVIDTDVGKKKVIGRNALMVPQIISYPLDQIQYNPVLKTYFATSRQEMSGCYGYSKDRINWNFVRNNAVFQNNFAYSETLGYFVMAGYYATYKSTDGIHWEILGTDTPFSNRPIIRVETMGLFFVFDLSDLYTSIDGKTWQRVGTPTGYNEFYGQEINGKIYFCPNGNDIDSYVYDGKEFTQINLKQFNNIQYVQELGLYIADGVGTRFIQKSTDGINWTQVEVGWYSSVDSICWIGEKLIVNAQSEGNHYWLESTDLINFTLVGETPYHILFMWYENGVITGCGVKGTIIQSEDDGETWELLKCSPVTSAVGMGDDIEIVNTIDKTYVLYSTKGLMSSTDGVKWKLENPNITLKHIEWIKEKELFVGFNGSGIYTSTDAITWTLRKTTTFAGKFCYSKKLDKIVSVYLVYNSSTEKVTVHSLTSTDGISWTDTTGINYTGNNNSGGIKNIAYSETLGVFVCGFDNTWFRSTNGTTWTRYTDSNVSINSLFRVDRDGYFYSFLEKMYKSADGITWTSTVLSEDNFVDSGAYSEELGMYIAVAEYTSENINSAYFVSTDGINWEEKPYQSTGLRYSVSAYSTIFGRFITGNIRVLNILMGEGEEVNFISKMSADSDISLNLEVGENNLIWSLTVGDGTVKIKYRQKYTGV